MEKMPKMELYLRRCDKCWKEIISVYPKWVEFKVYCEECYNKEMY
jgi:formylmethanofuran dehydrogenase subunit E